MPPSIWLAVLSALPLVLAGCRAAAESNAPPGPTRAAGCHLLHLRAPRGFAPADCEGLVPTESGTSLTLEAREGHYRGDALQLPPFDRAVLSTQVACPPETGCNAYVLVRTAHPEGATIVGCGPWSVHASGLRLSPKGPTEGPERVRVDVDTVRILGGEQAREVSLSVYLAAGPESKPALSGLTLCTWVAGTRRPFTAQRSPAWGRLLDVPERSQCVEDPAIAGSICSPTSLAMVLQFWGIRLPTAEVARGVYDAQAKIYGNWPFNTACAFEASGGLLSESYVARFGSLEELEAEIAAGRPTIISHRWKPGELTGAPVDSSDGHLIVVVGFDERGDVVVNDPAADPRRGASVRRTYPRREIYRSWLENADGVVYRIGPE
ncbi:MAG: peptidase C39 family protein [Planctomycetes bacterium]|nr:peptidase C39 family protein [Planctomycetota bacterium]